jgi:hypothetical protein
MGIDISGLVNIQKTIKSELENHQLIKQLFRKGQFSIAMLDMLVITRGYAETIYKNENWGCITICIL